MVKSAWAAELTSTPGDYVALLVVHVGVEYLDQGGRTAEVRAGTAALWDGVRPVACHSPGGLAKHTLFMPRDLLRSTLPDLDGVFTRTIPASSRETSMPEISGPRGARRASSSPRTTASNPSPTR